MKSQMYHIDRTSVCHSMVTIVYNHNYNHTSLHYGVQVVQR